MPGVKNDFDFGLNLLNSISIGKSYGANAKTLNDRHKTKF
jgi:hypothetical protein